MATQFLMKIYSLILQSLTVLLCLLGLGLGYNTQAQANPITKNEVEINLKKKQQIEFVKKAYHQIFIKTSQDEGFISNLIKSKESGKLFDFDLFFNLVTQDFDHLLTKQEYKKLQSEFTQLFVVLIHHNLPNFKKFDFQKEDFEYQKLTESLSKIKFTGWLDNTSKSGNNKQKISITFWLSQDQKGQNFIYDLEVKGAKLSRNYRSQLKRIFHVKKYSGLIESIRQKRREILTKKSLAQK